MQRCCNQPGPKQRQRHIVRQQGGVPIDHGQRQQRRRKSTPDQRRQRPAPAPRAKEKQGACHQLHQWVAHPIGRAADRAFSLKPQIAQHRNIFIPGNHMTTTGATRTRRQQIECLGGLGWLSGQFGTLICPLPLHHFGQTVDHHIEKASNEKAQKTNQCSIKFWRKFHEFHQTT